MTHNKKRLVNFKVKKCIYNSEDSAPEHWMSMYEKGNFAGPKYENLVWFCAPKNPSSLHATWA